MWIPDDIHVATPYTPAQKITSTTRKPCGRVLLHALHELHGKEMTQINSKPKWAKPQQAKPDPCLTTNHPFFCLFSVLRPLYSVLCLSLLCVLASLRENPLSHTNPIPRQNHPYHIKLTRQQPIMKHLPAQNGKTTTSKA